MAFVSAEALALARLLEPVAIAGVELRNRVVMAPMSRYLSPRGAPHAGNVRYYERRAVAGVGLIVSEGTYIDHPSAASYEDVPHFYGEALEGWRAVATAVHAAGGAMFPQLWHTGSFRHSGMGPEPGAPGLGPSENVNAFTKHPELSTAMTERDAAEVIESYAKAARAARNLGFDGVEIHGAHGYLIDEFFWAETNRRADRYGGDRRARTRFAVEVLRAIRASVGPDFPVSFRFSQFKQQDYEARLADTPAELAEVLEPLVEAGVSILHCSTRRVWEPGFASEGEMTLAGWAKRLTGLPVVAVGSVGVAPPSTGDAMAAIFGKIAAPILRGDFDLLAVGRALLADPEWVLKLREGRGNELIPFGRDQLSRLD